MVIFSNRMFPTKAVAIWRMLDDQKHVDLIAAYFHHAGNFVGIAAHNWSPSAYTDPVYVVLARKPAPAALYGLRQMVRKFIAVCNLSVV